MEREFKPATVSDETKVTEPVAPPSCSSDQDPNRLWIGNIDPKLTEFGLLKILQQLGTLVKYDYLYHKTGREKGQPRGFCFATYKSREEAIRAQKSLNGKQVMTRRIFVKWAHEQKEELEMKRQVKILGTGTVPESTKPADLDSQSAIRAIEAKLNSMAQTEILPPIPSLAPGRAVLPQVTQPRKTDDKRKKKPYHRPGRR